MSFNFAVVVVVVALDEISHKKCPFDEPTIRHKSESVGDFEEISKLVFYACRKNDK